MRLTLAEAQYWDEQDLGEVVAIANAALESTQEEPNRRLEGLAAGILAFTAWFEIDDVAGLQHVERLVSIAGDLDDARLLGEACGQGAVVALALGDRDAYASWAVRLREVDDRDRHGSGGHVPPFAMRAVLVGEWSVARSHAERQ